MADKQLDELYTGLGIANDEAKKNFHAFARRQVAKGSLILDKEELAEIYSNLGITNDETKKELVRSALIGKEQEATAKRKRQVDANPRPTKRTAMVDENQLEMIMKIEELKKRFAERIKKTEELKKRFAERIKKTEELKKRFAERIKESEELKKRYAELMKENEELKMKESEKLKKRYAELMKEGEELKMGYAERIKKTEELKKHYAELMKESEELKKHYAELMKESEELKKHYAELMKESEELKRCNEDLKKSKEKRFHLCEVLELTEDDCKLLRYSNTSHLYGKHAEANPTSVEGFKLFNVDVEKIKAHPDYDAYVSSLVKELKKRKSSPKYYNKADIANLVRKGMEDAIDLLELEGIFEEGELSVRPERSLFECRRDMLVVRGAENVGLIAVVVKEPLEGDLREYPTIIGHAYDHAMATKGFNIQTDIVLVTSFAESFIGSLQKEDLAQDANDGINDGTKRLLYVSKKDFGPHELVKLISTALKIAKKAYTNFQNKTYRLEHGERYFFPRALEVRDNAYQWRWRALEAKIGDPIGAALISEKNSHRQSDGNIPSVRTYYIVGSLGQGRTSNVFQALDHNSGELVAIKVFVDNDGNTLEKEAFEEKAKNACEGRKMALLECYEFLKGRVHVIKFCGYYAVVMPIFEPIPKDDREARLNDIEKVLVKLKENGLKFDPYDICIDISFRHVGMFQDNVVLFDLANLIPLDCDDEDCDVVKEQMEIFTEHCADDRPPNNLHGLFEVTKL